MAEHCNLPLRGDGNSLSKSESPPPRIATYPYAGTETTLAFEVVEWMPHCNLPLRGDGNPVD